jgi:hypothetical protein
MHDMFVDMSRREHQEKLKKAGIVLNEEHNLFGVPSKNIPFKYIKIDFIHDKFYVCYVKMDYVKMDIDDDFQMVTVCKEDGTEMFTVEEKSFDYLHFEDFFLVKERKEKNYMLHGLCGTIKTKHVFRPMFHSKFDKDSDFCILGNNDFSGECVINKKGEVVFEKKDYNSLYLHGNILSTGSKNYNLFTGELICDKSYHSSLDIKEFMFIQVDVNQVYKINKKTCEFEVFGEPKQAPKLNDIKICEHSDTTVAEVLPKLIKQGRNDICQCGSGKKFKNCCMKK